MTEIESATRRPGQPLLTIAIPTFNREPFLAELLESLLREVQGLSVGVFELIVSDNCSTDNTREVVAAFQQRGLACRYVRNEINLGSDSNFLQCMDLAQGQYVWVLGDDDLLIRDALSQILSLLAQDVYDMVYISSFGFSDPGTGRQVLEETLPSSVTRDSLGRFAELVTDSGYFLNYVNALVGLISVMIVNKNLLEAAPHPPFESLRDSNLIQVGWLFPLMHTRSRILCIWQRLVAYRSFNSTGWGVCEVFGIRLQAIAARYFAAEPELARALMNGVLRFWLFDKIYLMRTGIENAEMNAEQFDAVLRPIFRSNPRYWLFLYPVAELPLPLARVYYRTLAFGNKLWRAARTLARHWLHHGRYLRP